MDERGEPHVIGMKEVGQESQNPGIPPVGVKTTPGPAAAATKKRSEAQLWPWVVAAMFYQRAS
jgi:hypothetical protein